MGRLQRRKKAREKASNLNWEDLIEEEYQEEIPEEPQEEFQSAGEDAAWEEYQEEFQSAGEDAAWEEYPEEFQSAGGDAVWGAYQEEEYSEEECQEEIPEEILQAGNEADWEEEPCAEEYLDEEIEYYEEDPALLLTEEGEPLSGEEEYLSEKEEVLSEEEDFLTEEEEQETVYEKPEKKNPFALLWMRAAHMDTLDKVILVSGILALVIAIVAGSIYANMRIAADQAAEFVSVGSSLANVTLPGETGLLAVADMEASKKAAAEALEEEQRRLEEEANRQEQTEYHEEDYVNVIDVTMKLSSIEKDLKIKFVNKESGKLISNVPFSVEVKDAKGKSHLWTDDDMDGIIYQVDLDSGAYSVTVQELTDSKYKDYKLPSSAQSVEVKKEIVYEKVDVADEVKDETEVDVSKEETKPHVDETPEETIKDTVEWVESTQSPAGYEEIDKGSVKDPAAVTVVMNNSWRLSAPDGGSGIMTASTVSSIVPDSASLTLGTGESTILTTAGSDTVQGKWISDAPNVAAVEEQTGKVTAIAEGTANISYVDPEYVSGGDSGAAGWNYRVNVVKRRIVLSRSDAVVYVGIPVTVGVTLENVETSIPVAAVSSDQTIAAVSLNEGRTGLEISGLEEGSVAVTVSFQVNGSEYSASCAVTVKADPKTDDITKLKDMTGNQVYVLENNAYREAVAADYYTFDAFYVMGAVKYTGWQTLEGKMYYYDKDGVRVTGEQIIKGAKYNFDSDGALITDSGILGIDVSKWNGKIDWTAVKKSGISYVIIRSGYRGYGSGVLVEDPTFKANIEGALKAGLKVGIYFFTQAISQGEAVEEASMVLDQIKNYNISYPIFLDVEHSGGANGRADKISKADRTEVCRAFCQTIQNAGYTAGIYANKTWLTTMIDTPSLSAYKIWLAQYAASPTYTGRYDMWQYQANGKVSGVNGDVDLNWSYMGY